jgi:hypothetical protein
MTRIEIIEIHFAAYGTVSGEPAIGRAFVQTVGIRPDKDE